MSQLNEQELQRILERFDQQERIVVSDAYADGGTGPLFPRLERAVLNQIDEGHAVFPRYAIWANTVRDCVREAIRLIQVGEGEASLPLLRQAANSLSAFSEIQAFFDETGTGRRGDA